MACQGLLKYPDARPSHHDERRRGGFAGLSNEGEIAREGAAVREDMEKPEDGRPRFPERGRVVEEGECISHGRVHVLRREDLDVSPGEGDDVGPEPGYRLREDPLP